MRSRQQLVKNDPEREQIAPTVYGTAPELLRRHVTRRSYDVIATRHAFERRGFSVRRFVADLFRESEVRDLDMAIPPDHHVRRLQIPVDDFLFVRLLERFRHLYGNAQPFSKRWPFSLQPTRERLTIDVFHRYEGPCVSVRLSDLINLADIRMIESRRGLGFPTQASQGGSVVLQPAGQKLQRDRPMKLRVLRLPDHTHPAFADLFDQAVVE